MWSSAFKQDFKPRLFQSIATILRPWKGRISGHLTALTETNEVKYENNHHVVFLSKNKNIKTDFAIQGYRN